mmetsp:Transcript_10848/g.33267  ORF Transcript_10848/g.33267 Transcript_10848/m.33267 type:complete len:635 (-) Transcript_10848:236-2140(-)
MTAKRSNRRSGGRSGERGKCLRVMLFGSHSVEEWKRLLEERSVNDGQKQEQQKVRRSDSSTLYENRRPAKSAKANLSWAGVVGHRPVQDRTAAHAVQAKNTSRNASCNGANLQNVANWQPAASAESFMANSEPPTMNWDGADGVLMNKDPQSSLRSTSLSVSDLQLGSLNHSQDETPNASGRNTPSHEKLPGPSTSSSGGRKSWARVASNDLSVTDSSESDAMNGGVHEEEVDGAVDLKELSKQSQVAPKDQYSLAVHLYELFGVGLRKDVPYRMPRGMVNSGNTCFINVVLQALMACKPFRILMHSLEHVTLPNSMPLLNAFVRTTAAMFEDARDDDARREPLRPDFVLNAQLDGFQSGLGDSFAALVTGGSQEDAQEFLVQTLDRLHEETLPRKENGDRATADQDDEDGWEEVGRRGRIAKVKESEYVPSCISCVFGGVLRSELRRPNQKPSVMREPFMCLELGIENSHVLRVEDALQLYFEPESLEGYMLESTKETVEAKKHNTLDRLPRALILNLKRFSYNAETRIGAKITKKVEFGEELVIQNNSLSSNKIAPAKEQRTYKLTAVVTHIGKEIAGGHYVCDVRVQKSPDLNGGSSEWVHCDDSNITSVAPSAVLSRQAYLLFYTLTTEC